MSHTEDIAAYLREKKADPLRDNIVKTAMVNDALGIDRNHCGVILSAMERGEVEGVDLSVWSNSFGSGGKKYEIQSVSENVSKRIVVDAELCAEIRRNLKQGQYTLKELGAEIGVSATQVSNHGRGMCSHVIAERPVTSQWNGERYDWIEVE